MQRLEPQRPYSGFSEGRPRESPDTAISASRRTLPLFRWPGEGLAAMKREQT